MSLFHVFSNIKYIFIFLKALLFFPLTFQEVDDFFEQEKNFLINYYNRIKDSCAKADRMTRSHKSKCIYPLATLLC